MTSWLRPYPLITAPLRQELGSYRLETQKDEEIYLLERGCFRPLGPYMIHLALLLILAAGMIGKFWGVEGQLALDQGEVAGAFQVGPRTEKPLHFQVRPDSFKVSYYELGAAPKEFCSDLTFIRDGRKAARATCRVNEPVSFGGLTFYQASYGSEATGPICLIMGSRAISARPSMRLFANRWITRGPRPDGVGGNHLEPMLELGPQGDLAADHLVRLRGFAACQALEGLVWTRHRLAGRCWGPWRCCSPTSASAFSSPGCTPTLPEKARG